MGAAAVDFQVSTGRMPLPPSIGAENAAQAAGAEHRPRPARSPPTSPPWAAARPIPSAAQVNTSGADVGLGQQLFVADCAQCHNFVGAGGALTYGKFAPALTQSTPTQIYEAMLTGPEAMPVFNDATITPDQKRDIIAYVTSVRSRSRTPAASAWAGSGR